MEQQVDKKMHNVSEEVTKGVGKVVQKLYGVIMLATVPKPMSY